MFSWFKIGPFDLIECVKARSAPSCTFCLGDSSHYVRNPKTCVTSLQHMTLLDLCVIFAQGAMLNMFDTRPQSLAELVRLNFATPSPHSMASHWGF